jgi:hypothetical protein
MPSYRWLRPGVIPNATRILASRLIDWLRVENFVLVGAASCRDDVPVAAGCRSYSRPNSHQIATFKP